MLGSTNYMKCPLLTGLVCQNNVMPAQFAKDCGSGNVVCLEAAFLSLKTSRNPHNVINCLQARDTTIEQHIVHTLILMLPKISHADLSVPP